MGHIVLFLGSKMGHLSGAKRRALLAIVDNCLFLLPSRSVTLLSSIRVHTCSQTCACPSRFHPLSIYPSLSLECIKVYVSLQLTLFQVCFLLADGSSSDQVQAIGQKFADMHDGTLVTISKLLGDTDPKSSDAPSVLRTNINTLGVRVPFSRFCVSQSSWSAAQSYVLIASLSELILVTSMFGADGAPIVTVGVAPGQAARITFKIQGLSPSLSPCFCVRSAFL